MRVVALLLIAISCSLALRPLPVSTKLNTGDETIATVLLQEDSDTVANTNTNTNDDKMVAHDNSNNNNNNNNDDDAAEKDTDDDALPEEDEESETENDKDSEELNKDEKHDETSMLETTSKTTATATATKKAAAAAPAAAAPAIEAQPTVETPAIKAPASSGPTFPLWYTTTMLGQAALSGGYSPMGGLGRRATTTGPAHGGKLRSKLVPLAPEAYETALLATHLQVRSRQGHAGTIPLGADDYERREALEMKQFHEFQKQQAMMQQYYAGMQQQQPGQPMGAALKQPQMPMGYPAPPQMGGYPQMPMGAYGNPMMPAPQMAGYPQMPMGAYGNPMMGAQPGAYPYGMPPMYNPAAMQQQQASAAAGAPALKGKKSIKLSGNKIEGLQSSLLSEITAANKRGYKDE